MESKWPVRTDSLDYSIKDSQEYFKSKFNRDDLIKYGNLVYRILYINFKCYCCIALFVDKDDNKITYLSIKSVNEEAKYLGRDLEIVRMLYL